MTQKEMRTALGGYLAAMGVPSDRAEFALPYLTGEKALPNEALAATSAAENAVVKLLTFPEAARMLGTSRSTVFRMTKDGTLNPVNFRGKNKIRLAEVLALAEEMKTPTGACHCGGACVLTPELEAAMDEAANACSGKAANE